MFLPGEACPSVALVCGGSDLALRVGLMGQESAEVIVPMGLMVWGRAEREELIGMESSSCGVGVER